MGKLSAMDWLVTMSATLVGALLAIPTAYLIAAPFWRWAGSGLKKGRGLRYRVAKARVQYWADKPDHQRVVGHQIPVQIGTLSALLQVGMAVSKGFGLESEHDMFQKMVDEMHERSNEVKHPFNDAS